jgi:hypothetical protein
MAPQREPICPLCSKPIRSGSLVIFEHGEYFHVRCRSRAVELAAMDAAERADSGRARAASKIAKLAARQAHLAERGLRGCPLCGEAAIVTDWRPSRLEWVVVEGCACGDFFVSAAVFKDRLPWMSHPEREALVARIRWFRSKGIEAWCTTIDGTVDGPLDIRQRRIPSL